MEPEWNVLTVSELNQYIKKMMDQDGTLRSVLVEGEISNYRLYPSGHHYFTLKDADGVLHCVMFRREAAGLTFKPASGMQVVAAGRVSVYPKNGEYQLFCSYLFSRGAGDLHLAFEQLKEKLRREGLFDERHKKPIPRFPGRIALITSASGKVVSDMTRILGARWPLARVVVLPVLVQGDEAPGDICRALDYANRVHIADLIIVGRGGGSAEDLWAFNDEGMARAIYRSEIPVISAVGHEPDVTIADYVADYSAATPSNAAERAVPDQNEIRAILAQLGHRMGKALRGKADSERRRLDRLCRSRVMTRPDTMFQQRRMTLDYMAQRLSHALERNLSREKSRYGRLSAKMDALSPYKVLGRGYAIPLRPDGGVIGSAADLSRGDRLTLKLKDGSADCLVEESRCEHGGRETTDL